MRNKYTIVFHPKAEKEYLESLIWYEDSLIGLGQEFYDEIKDTINHISQSPLSFPTKKLRYREAPVKKFPFIVVYEIKQQKHQIRILAVFHTSRNPKLKLRGKKK